MVGITYSLHKMRNSLRRSVSGFNMMFHTLNHIQYAFESIYNSPIIPVTKKFTPVLDWLGGAFNTLGLCFYENTPITTIKGTINIGDIRPGQELDKNNYVISIHKFINTVITNRLRKL